MKLGFIGAGNMAQAIVGGVLQAGLIPKEEIIASDVSAEPAERMKKKFGIQTTLNNEEAATADIIFLATKPIYTDSAIRSIRAVVSDGQIIVSIVAGKSLESLEGLFGAEKKIIRTMPNTPALVGEGVTAVCPNRNVAQSELDFVLEILRSFGRAETVPEHLMSAVVAVSGSSPAYVFMMIEAMADAAVAEGMSRDLAYQFASQAVLGSAKLVLETGKHPGELKDMVCSPGGTTIDAVKVLEECGFRGAIMDAMHACAEKSLRL